MNTLKAQLEWQKMGNIVKDGYIDENNNFVIEFINKNDEVVGTITAYRGQGIGWNYPQELMDKINGVNNKTKFKLNGDMAQQFNETYPQDEFEDDGAYANDYL